ncbi:MAG: IS982 family transposase [Pseudomonadota bacterium]
MDTTTFMISVFCFVDDWLKGRKLRQRGPAPTLSDSEVLTIEIVGEFLQLDTDKGLFGHFRRYYADWFPALRQIDRTTFVRQAANLWLVKAQLWQDLLMHIEHDPALSILDSFPVPVCRFARAYRCRRLAEWAAFGYDEMEKRTFYGLRAHVRISWPGVITQISLAPANAHDLSLAEEILEGACGWALGDRNYWSPALHQQLRTSGLYLLAPYKSARRERHPWPRRLVQARRRIETVIGQLVERFHAKRVWARDLWHLCSRWLRKVLSHTFAVFLCQQAGISSPLRFAELVTD